ncbi:MAG: cyclase family protein [Alphaproteobacteria bacterium]
MSGRWKRRPDGSNWGEFGPDDQKGRLNFLTPERVKAGIAEVRDGKVFSLSLPLDRPGKSPHPARHAPRIAATIRNGQAGYNFPLSSVDPEFYDIVSDDVALIHTQFSTQWDSFAHWGAKFDADGDGTPEPVYYNGWRAGADVRDPIANEPAKGWERFPGVAAKALGIEHMAESGVQGRGVMIDLHARFGRARKLVGYDDIMRICDADKVGVEKGDMVCLHTGFDDVILEMGAETDTEALHHACPVLDGRDQNLLDWITDSGMACLIADNFAVEAYPARTATGARAALPLHEHCLFKLGVHLGELWHLGPLAAWLRERGRSRFLLTAPPLNLPGAVGSPVTPVATV